MNISYRYIAVLIDGEGCLSIYKEKSERSRLGFSLVPTLQIRMCGENSKKLLELVKKKIGGKVYKTKKQKEYYKTPYLFILTGSRIKEPLGKIINFLILKKEVGLTIQEFFKYYP